MRQVDPSIFRVDTEALVGLYSSLDTVLTNLRDIEDWETAACVWSVIMYSGVVLNGDGRSMSIRKLEPIVTEVTAVRETFIHTLDSVADFVSCYLTLASNMVDLLESLYAQGGRPSAQSPHLTNVLETGAKLQRLTEETTDRFAKLSNKIYSLSRAIEEVYPASQSICAALVPNRGIWRVGNVLVALTMTLGGLIGTLSAMSTTAGAGGIVVRAAGAGGVLYPAAIGLRRSLRHGASSIFITLRLLIAL